jgi:hypothetical protein
MEITLAANARLSVGHNSDHAGPAGPGLRIFTAGHYAVLDVHTTEPRPGLPRSNPTAADYMATWGVFGANAGTYELTDTLITMHATVAKNPEIMAPGVKSVLGVRVHGDTMWMWSIGGRLGSGELIRFKRLE